MDSRLNKMFKISHNIFQVIRKIELDFENLLLEIYIQQSQVMSCLSVFIES
jgi:hypothetical protein